MIAEGELSLDDYGWHSTLPDWVLLSHLLSEPSIVTADPGHSSSSRKSIDADDYRDPTERKWFYISFTIFALAVITFSIATGGAFVILIAGIFGFAAIHAIWQLNHLLGHCVRVSEKQFPDVYSLVLRAANNLDMRPPNVFIQQADHLNAFASGLLGNKCIVLTSEIACTMAEDELTAIIGHELSHLKCGHTTWTALTGSAGSLGVPYVSQVFAFVFLFWSRKAEFTCDRGGLLACRNLKACASALAKLATGKQLFDKLDLDVFLAQRSERGENELGRLTELFSTHPAIVDRIHSMTVFYDSEQYRRLIAGSGL